MVIQWLAAAAILVASAAAQRDTLYGLPPIPGEPLPTTTAAPTTRHRLFRFGPFLPYIPHIHLPQHTIPAPVITNAFDAYNHINPIPELPPRPEAKLNGFFNADGNFVPFGGEAHAPSPLIVDGRPVPRAKRDLISDDSNTLQRRIVEEEYAYDEDLGGLGATPPRAVTTPRPPTTTTPKASFISGNAVPRHRLHPSNPNVKPRMVSGNVQMTGRTSHVVSPKPQRPRQQYPSRRVSTPPAGGALQPLKPALAVSASVASALQRPAILPRPTRRPATAGGLQAPPPGPAFQPIQVVAAIPPQQLAQYQQPQYYPPPQYQYPAQAWAAPVATPPTVDTRDPVVIAYLRDLEDYDWNYAGERPDLNSAARHLPGHQANLVAARGPTQVQVPAASTPETLVPLNSNSGTLIGTTPLPYVPARVTAPLYPSTAAPPLPSAPGFGFTAAPGGPAAGGDLFGLFGGTPHPLLDLRRLFAGAGRR